MTRCPATLPATAPIPYPPRGVIPNAVGVVIAEYDAAERSFPPCSAADQRARSVAVEQSPPAASVNATGSAGRRIPPLATRYPLGRPVRSSGQRAVEVIPSGAKKVC